MSTQEVVKKWNNTDQEAKRLGVPRSWLWRMARSGKIPCGKCGKYYFWDPRQTDDWIKSQGS